MTDSMTAYARASADTEQGAVTWELRSVNNRFLDINLRLPDELRGLEAEVRERIGARLRRGKLDCNLRVQAGTASEGGIALNMALAESVAHACRQLDAVIYDAGRVSSMELLRWPGVIDTRPPELDAIGATVLEVLGLALDDLLATRAREGAQLAALLDARCAAIEATIEAVRERLPAVVSATRERLRARLAEVRAELDPARLEQEMVLFCHKLDVAEELDRLATHVTEVRRVLGGDGAIGRRLDFLMQELNREANTLGSKSVDADITRAAVDLKVFIEQMREQVQNLE